MTGLSLTHSVHRVLLPIIYCCLTNESKLCDLEQPTVICQSPSQWVRNWGRAHLGRWLRVSCGFSPVMAGIRTAGDWSRGWLTRHISLSPLLPSPSPPSLHHPFLLSPPSLPHPFPVISGLHVVSPGGLLCTSSPHGSLMAAEGFKSE